MNKFDEFKKEVAKLCEKYRVGLTATCISEGIYGELTIFDLDDQSSSFSSFKGHHGETKTKELEEIQRENHLNWSTW